MDINIRGIMDINLVKCAFICYVVILGGLALLFHCMEFYSFVIQRRRDSFRSATMIPQPMVWRSEVNRRWFGFDIFPAPIFTVTLLVILYKYLYNRNAPLILYELLLDTFLGISRKPLVPAEKVILALILLNIYSWRRYDMLGVLRVEGMIPKNYVSQVVPYIGLIASVIGEFEGFIRDSQMTSLSWTRLTDRELVPAFICLWSMYMQMSATFTPRTPRKNQHGAVIAYIYTIPVDGLFKYISNPFEFTEILVYLMLSVILWEASTFHYFTIWVTVNQVVCAILSHRWYKNTFRNYPRERKILIPYIW